MNRKETRDCIIEILKESVESNTEKAELNALNETIIDALIKANMLESYSKTLQEKKLSTIDKENAK